MRYWIGGTLFVAAVWLVIAALAHRRRALAAGWREIEPVSPGSLLVFGEIMRPIVLFALAYLAVKSVLVYWMLEAERYLSLFDVAGFLAALAGYGTWFVMKTKYSLSALARAVPVPPRVPAQAANDPVASPQPTVAGR
jgi:hypothetical protein